MAEPTKNRQAGQGTVAKPSSKPSAQEPVVLRQADEAVGTILAREAYTYARHIFLLRTIYCILGALVLQSCAVLYMATRPPVNHYFITDTAGRIQAITPLDRPINSQTDLNNWVANSIVAAYTMDFANWRAELTAAQGNFTPSGWRGFRDALDTSGLLKSIIENKYVTSAVPTGAPVLLDEGLVQGRYAYRLQMPLLVSFQTSDGKTAAQNMKMNIVVERIPQTEDPRGLGIAQLIALSN
jgi:intracellular multiplication protein IcmL